MFAIVFFQFSSHRIGLHPTLVYIALSGLSGASSGLTGASKKLYIIISHSLFPLATCHSPLILHSYFNSKLLINLSINQVLITRFFLLAFHHSPLTVHSCFYIEFFINLVRPALRSCKHGICLIIVFKSFFDGIPV